MPNSVNVSNVFKVVEIRGELSLVHKLIPFGIYPGAKIEIISVGKKGVLIKVDSSIIFIDNKIFSKILIKRLNNEN